MPAHDLVEEPVPIRVAEPTREHLAEPAHIGDRHFAPTAATSSLSEIRRSRTSVRATMQRQCSSHASTPGSSPAEGEMAARDPPERVECPRTGPRFEPHRLEPRCPFAPRGLGFTLADRQLLVGVSETESRGPVGEGPQRRARVHKREGRAALRHLSGSDGAATGWLSQERRCARRRQSEPVLTGSSFGDAAP